jgi:putative colanic acid biosynthesis UDP-glucose lipid carrier transferase
MKKRFNTYFPSFFIFGELVVIAIIYILAAIVADGKVEFEKFDIYAFVIYLSVWPIISFLNKDYKIGRAVSYYTTLKRAFASVFIFISLISLFWLFSATEALNRHFLGTLIILLFLWVTIYRVSVHLVLDKYRTFGGNVRYAAIIGYDKLGFNLFKVLSKKTHYGIRCQGIFGTTDDPNINLPYLGDYDDFLKSDFQNIDFIYVSEKVPKRILNKIIASADLHLKKVKLLPEIKTDALKSLVLRRFDSVPIIDLNKIPLDVVLNKIVKRTFDLIFCLIVLVTVMSWMYPIFALIIKLESKGSVFFRQWRHGEGGRKFICYKFRTMIINDEADNMWASKDDPRITKFGAFLRKTSLDEFPQFVNVLFGSMSIVGPRPHPISLNESYERRVEKFSKRHASKPGVTGLAQAMGYRGEIKEFYHMSSRVKLDRFYLQNWSFLLDIKIIILTVFSVLRGTDNAY